MDRGVGDYFFETLEFANNESTMGLVIFSRHFSCASLTRETDPKGKRMRRRDDISLSRQGILRLFASRSSLETVTGRV